MSFLLQCARKFRWIGAVLIGAGVIIIVLFVPSWLWMSLLGVFLILLGVLFFRLVWRL